jgi:hypothetical protein
MLPSLPRVSDVSYSNMRKYTYIQNYLYHVKFNERTLACRNERSEQVLKQVCVVGRGCSRWVMSLMFSPKKMKMKRKNSWNNPRGLRSMAYSYKNVLF